MALQNIKFDSINIVEAPLDIGEKFPDEINIHKLRCKFEEKQQFVVDKELLFWNNFNLSSVSPSTSNAFNQSTNCYIGLTEYLYDPSTVDFVIETYDLTGTLLDTSTLIDYDSKFPIELKYCRFYPEWQNEYSVDGKFSYREEQTEMIYVCVENTSAFDLRYHVKIDNNSEFAFSNTIRINSGQYNYLAFKKQRDYNAVSSTPVPVGSTSYDLLGDSTILVSTSYSSSKLAVTIDNTTLSDVELFATTISSVNSTELYSKTPLVVVSGETSKTLYISDSDWAFNEYRNLVPAANDSTLSMLIPIISSDSANPYIGMDMEIVFSKISSGGSFDYTVDYGATETVDVGGSDGFIDSISITGLDPTTSHSLVINNTVNMVSLVAVEVKRKRKVIYDSLIFSFEDNKVLGITDDVNKYKYANKPIDSICESLLSSEDRLFTSQQRTWSSATISHDFICANNFEEKFPIIELNIYSKYDSGSAYFDRYRIGQTERTTLLNNYSNKLIIENDTKAQFGFSGTVTTPFELVDIRLPYFIMKDVNCVEYFDLFLVIKGEFNQSLDLTDLIKVRTIFEQNQTTYDIEEEEAAQDDPSVDLPEIGELIAFASNWPPRKFLACDGSLVSMTTYENLYDVMIRYDLNAGTSVAVDYTNNLITVAGHGLLDGDIVEFTSSIVLPVGLSADTKYYVVQRDNDNFKVSDEYNGAPVELSDNGNGDIRFHNQFSVPDFRGRFVRGYDNGRIKDPDASSRTANDLVTVIGDEINSFQADLMQSHKHNDSGHRHGYTRYSQIVKWEHNSTHRNFWGTSTQWSGYGYANLGDPANSGSGVPPIANETRPINRYVTYCIRYEL